MGHPLQEDGLAQDASPGLPRFALSSYPKPRVSSSSPPAPSTSTQTPNHFFLPVLTAAYQVPSLVSEWHHSISPLPLPLQFKSSSILELVYVIPMLKFLPLDMASYSSRKRIKPFGVLLTFFFFFGGAVMRYPTESNQRGFIWYQEERHLVSPFGYQTEDAKELEFPPGISSCEMRKDWGVNEVPARGGDVSQEEISHRLTVR